MITAAICVVAFLMWLATTWLAYRIGMGIGVTRAAMFAAEALGEAMAKAEVTLNAKRLASLEGRLDVN